MSYQVDNSTTEILEISSSYNARLLETITSIDRTKQTTCDDPTLGFSKTTYRNYSDTLSLPNGYFNCRAHLFVR